MLTQRIGFHVMLTFVTIAFIAIVLPFYSAILWAVVFAILFYPVHARLERALGGRRNTAAGLSMLICLCLVIVPGLLIFSSLVRQAGQLYQRIQSGEIDIRQLLRQLEEAVPDVVRDRLQTWELSGFSELRDRLSSGLLESGSFFAGRALSFGQNTVQFLIAFGIMLYLLFFLFRDGRELAQAIKRAIPLSDDHTGQFAARFTSVVRATVRGNVIIAALQGLIGGIAFWALGLKPAFLWGVAMAILSLLPAVGAALVWVPAALYLALSGLWGKALVLVLVGVFVIGLIDNLLRPPLVGQETRLPDYVVLISTVGGISLLGMNGFVIGPLIAALFIAAWSIFVEEESP